MRKFEIIALILSLLFVVQCQSKSNTKKEMSKKEGVKSMVLVSSAFKAGDMIPPKYTCDGENISPELSWSGAPAGTKSFALIADDPDAPMGTWVHWVVYNIPDTTHQLKEGIPPVQKLPDGSLQGMTDFRKIGYGGPCPPSGVHRYYFKLYALDTMLSLPAGVTKAELLKAMEGHVLAKTELIGRYSRK